MHRDQQQLDQQHSAAAGRHVDKTYSIPAEAAAAAAAQGQQQGGCLTAAQGTRWYRAPELLYGSRSYGPAVDIWAAGMVFAELLGLSPLIPGQSDIDQLARMQQTLGSITLQQWPEAGQLPDWHKISFGPNPGHPLAQLLPDAPAPALDLLAEMILYDPSQRMTATAALKHAYFSVEFMVFTAMLVAFGAFLRKANVCAASRSLSHVQRSLLRRDVVVDRAQYCLFVTLRFMKNSQYQESTHRVVIAGRHGHPLDPVWWWCSYVELVPAPPEAAAFGYMSGGVYVPLVHTEFVRLVKQLLLRAGFDSSKYAGHSFRRGAASFSFLVGLPSFLIKELGAWRSQVYQVYLDLSLSQKLSVHSAWFDAMAAGQLGSELVPPS
ncbi:kinase-like domain-containing protein [Scenedesmus sp. NREL 46B-D3]|nr:kinase-like domain-containing protein [Scenedesmus sp. NREL 46B-D3]